MYMLWLFYLAVMSLQRARDTGTLSKPAYILGLPIFFLGWAIDFVANMIPASFLFLEFPEELLVTARLRKHVQEKDGWRKTLALFLCKNLLDTFDPSGSHCKE